MNHSVILSQHVQQEMPSGEKLIPLIQPSKMYIIINNIHNEEQHNGVER